MHSSKHVTINIADLRRTAALLFDHVEQLGYRSIDVDADYYWIIDRSSRYNPYEDPTEFSLLSPT